MGHPVLVVPPTTPIVELDELKSHVVVDDDFRDPLLLTYLAAATEYAERFTGRAIMPQTWEQRHDRFLGRRLVLPIGPVVGIVELATVALDGTETILDPTLYRVETGLVGRVEAVNGWPSTTDRAGAIRIRWTAGDGVCPPGMKVAIMMHVASLFANREAATTGPAASLVPMGAMALLERNRIFRG